MRVQFGFSKLLIIDLRINLLLAKSREMIKIVMVLLQAQAQKRFSDCFRDKVVKI